MKILVTGANGMLGQDLCPILEDVGAFVIETDVDTLDITDENAVTGAISDVHPDVVIHCAAYTNVDKAEEEPAQAELINVKGTENLAKICGKLEIPLVYISTDYVFDGSKKEPYKPDDLPNPINVYGKTKLAGEDAVKKYCNKYYIVRTSWLYGHYGRNFVETMLELAGQQKEVKVVDDQTGCPTWTVELANGILKLLSKPYGTYHVCGSGSTSWHGFAQEIFNQTGLSVNLKPCKTEDFPRPAMRPQYSVMDNESLCRSWQAALHDYIELRDV
ncbi:dTDP-4-dehydrorhamnose reductase [Brachyspira sp. CAG:484]|nr:dTDP-4-dehydrorhamnose reductase [Brachyspira sp. CAG:484]